ncbi:MAG: hypothetical protein B7C24_08350 [Bacteroidetes bacterium 4572_77]|nr:MAG: hypothetical protein B7C24_08350 [Bacteroidetes bacterium 4572_77]
MKKFIPITILFFAFYLGQSLISFAQEKQIRQINLQHADIGRFGKVSGKNAQRLIGNVRAEHDGSILLCDSAYLYQENNSMDAYGHVHIIVNDSLDVYGDQLFYNGNTKIAEVHRNVRLVDKKATLYTDELIYDRNTAIGTYYIWGRIVDSTNVLTSKKGYYYSAIETVFFKDSVVVINPDYIMNSDTLKYETNSERVFFYGPTNIKGDSSYLYAEDGFYDTESKELRLSENAFMQKKSHTISGDSIYYNKFYDLAEAFRNVVLTDTANDVLITGEYGFYQKWKKYAYVVDSAQAILLDGLDTLFVHADTLMVSFDSTEKTKDIKAFHAMKFYKKTIQGMADSMVYSFSDSILHFYKKPVFWFEENQISCERMDFVSKNTQLDSAVFYNDVFLVSQDTVDSTFYNQVSGETMYAWFVDNDLKKIYMKGKSETIYYIWEEDGSSVGMTYVSSKDMLIYLEDQQLKSITYITKPSPVTYPLNEVMPGQDKLENFSWRIEDRPLNRADIFRKKISVTPVSADSAQIIEVRKME